MSEVSKYLEQFRNALENTGWEAVQSLCDRLLKARNLGHAVYLCGNGGSAGNAIHLANDFLYGSGGLRVESLAANAAVITCLANDTGYENIFAEQIRTKGRADDVLIALSGSGNSPNIVRALQAANEQQIDTFAILGFDGGKCKSLAAHPIHFSVNDMQIVEDIQLMVGHICMKFLKANQPENSKGSRHD